MTMTEYLFVDRIREASSQELVASSFDCSAELISKQIASSFFLISSPLNQQTKDRTLRIRATIKDCPYGIDEVFRCHN